MSRWFDPIGAKWVEWTQPVGRMERVKAKEISDPATIGQCGDTPLLPMTNAERDWQMAESCYDPTDPRVEHPFTETPPEDGVYAVRNKYNYNWHYSYFTQNSWNTVGYFLGQARAATHKFVDIPAGLYSSWRHLTPAERSTLESLA